MKVLGIDSRGGAFAALTLIFMLISGCSQDVTDVVDDEPEDLTPPSRVTDLRVVAPTPSSLGLRWTAPGDDGDEGFAVAYDLRGAEEVITGENFGAAVEIILEGSPLPPGTTEEVLIDSLEEGHEYFFALKARDDSGNVSELSNCAQGTCLIEQAVAVPDANLRQLLQETLGIQGEDFFLSDMLQLISLSGNDRDIADLTGLEAAANLRNVNLLGNQISDPSPLGGLVGLEGLNLTMNQLTDISALQDLTGLIHFGCGQNQLTDVSVVSGLTQLQSLSIHSNPLQSLPSLESLALLTSINIGNLGLTDLALIENRVLLQYLIANGNQISDLEVLAAFPDLREAYLSHNQITDLAPLVGNTAFAEGDQLDVRSNPLSQVAIEEQIPALLARGVTVAY